MYLLRFAGDSIRDGAQNIGWLDQFLQYIGFRRQGKTIV